MDKTPVQRIVEAYRAKVGNGNGPLPYRKFSDALDNVFSAQELQFFESGDQTFGINRLRKLITLWHNTKPEDWRHLFAADLMAATLPEVISPEGEIGQSALEQNHKAER